MCLAINLFRSFCISAIAAGCGPKTAHRRATNCHSCNPAKVGAVRLRDAAGASRRVRGLLFFLSSVVPRPDTRQQTVPRVMPAAWGCRSRPLAWVLPGGGTDGLHDLYGAFPVK